MKKRIKLIILVFIIIGSIGIGATYGRYVYQDIKNFYLATKNFYFNSDKLKEKMARYQIDNWSGVDSFNIIVNMNSLKINPYITLTPFLSSLTLIKFNITIINIYTNIDIMTIILMVLKSIIFDVKIFIIFLLNKPAINKESKTNN